MKKKRGFTLIELLAVIVILAIIAIIAIPIILNMIENAKKGAARDTAYGYIDAIEYNNGFADSETPGYTMIPDNDDEKEFYTVEEINEYNIKYRGKGPDSGVVTIKKRKVSSASLCIGKYKVDYNGKEVNNIEKSSDCSAISEDLDDIEVVVPDEHPCELATETKDSKEIYYIDSAEDLYAFSESVNGGNDYSGKTVVLRNSIDLSDYTKEKKTKVCTDNDNANGFTPIGTSDHPFKGNFEGGARTISNLTIDKTNQDNVGLFGYTYNASLKGIIIDNINVKGNNYVGGIVGYKFGGSLSEVVVMNSNVRGNSSVALAIGITNGSYSIRGQEDNILIKSGTVNANTFGASAIGQIGDYINSSTIVVEEADVTANSGAFVIGNSSSSASQIAYSKKVKYNNESSGFSETSIGDINFYESIGLDTWIGGDNNRNGYYFDYKNDDVTIKKNDDNVFALKMEKDSNDYYLIKNEKDWKQATANMSQKYLLTKNINFKNNKFYMMGSSSNPFTGSFDGGAKVISNINIFASDGNNIGLFGYTNKAALKGIIINNAIIKGNTNVGGIVGYKFAGTLKDTIVQNAKIDGESRVALTIGTTVGDYSNRGQDESILIKNGTVNANTYGASTIGYVGDYTTVTGVIVEQANITATSGAVVTGNTNEYVTKTSYSKKAKYNNESNGFSESDIGDINFYESIGLDTWIGGDNNSTGYCFDYDNANISLVKFNNEITMEKDSNNYYLITNEEDWKLATANLSEKYKLTKNLNFENENFYMMGSANNAYTGSFDGGAKTISNVTINATKGNDIGVFGYINKASLKGITVDNVTIKGNNYVGGIVGYNFAGSLIEGLVKSANITGNTEVAGVIGINTGDYSNRGQVNNILVKNATVKANERGAGIMGFLDFYSYNSNAIVENVTITATSGSAISGYNYQNSFSNSYYSNQVKLNGDTQTNGFDSSNIDNLNYYKDKVETKLNGDNNNTGYYFDSVNGKVVIVPSSN